jgi:hypothetical protein
VPFATFGVLLEVVEMNDRQRAIALLTEARDALAHRLTERVLELADEVLADARGDSYMNEIDSLYEQIGLKLAHVNQLLASLPQAQAAPQKTANTAAGSSSFDTYSVTGDPDLSYTAERALADHPPALMGPVIVAAPALTGPSMAAPMESHASGDLHALGGFFKAIQSGQILVAGQTLAVLLGLETQRSIVCAAHFAERLRLDPVAVRRLLLWRFDPKRDSSSVAAEFLREAFGLSQEEAERAVAKLDWKSH